MSCPQDGAHQARPISNACFPWRPSHDGREHVHPGSGRGKGGFYRCIPAPAPALRVGRESTRGLRPRNGAICPISHLPMADPPPLSKASMVYLLSSPSLHCEATFQTPMDQGRLSRGPGLAWRAGLTTYVGMGNTQLTARPESRRMVVMRNGRSADTDPDPPGLALEPPAPWPGGAPMSILTRLVRHLICLSLGTSSDVWDQNREEIFRPYDERPCAYAHRLSTVNLHASNQWPAIVFPPALAVDVGLYLHASTYARVRIGFRMGRPRLAAIHALYSTPAAASATALPRTRDGATRWTSIR